MSLCQDKISLIRTNKFIKYLFAFYSLLPELTLVKNKNPITKEGFF
jgi:hypothetical protein